MFSSVSSSWLLSIRASSITCWPSRISSPASCSANRNGGSTTSMPSGMPATPSALRMSRISIAAFLKSPALGDTAPRMPTMPASDCFGRDLRRVEPMVARGRAEVPHPRLAVAGQRHQRVSLSRAHSPMTVPER